MSLSLRVRPVAYLQLMPPFGYRIRNDLELLYKIVTAL